MLENLIIQHLIFIEGEIEELRKSHAEYTNGMLVIFEFEHKMLTKFLADSESCSNDASFLLE